MVLPDWIHFWQRPFPSGNVVLLKTTRPVLIDSGYGSDVEGLVAWLVQTGTQPAALQWLINTHYHSDHVGGNHFLQTRYQVPIAAHRWEADMINQGDREACGAEYLDQPVEPYQVDRPLLDGDILDLGDRELGVIHTPGHTLGHISLYLPEEKILICGDAVQARDVAWINPYREGAGALARMMLTLQQLADLDVKIALSGHGEIIVDWPAAVQRALRRYEKWQQEPEKVGWHACKRIFAYKLMITNGLPIKEAPDYLLQQAWFMDFSRHLFGVPPADFIDPFMTEMARSGAARIDRGKLVAGGSYTKPSGRWAASRARPYD
ncbi:MAG: MBL fold metallo-hydrolase [Ardenticatenaceae bacterium]|nr:MBL fold metallo-hydrolase [Ardenticatenaceae bacterium]